MFVSCRDICRRICVWFFSNRFEANSRQPMIFFQAIWGLSWYDLNFIFVSCMPQIAIAVRMPRTVRTFLVEPSCTVHALKVKIAHEMGIEVGIQRLFKDDDFLTDVSESSLQVTWDLDLAKDPSMIQQVFLHLFGFLSSTSSSLHFHDCSP